MILAFAGGVGGARLANGLARILPAGGLTVAVNVGDDFEHLGLHISPDPDTVMYTLAGLNDAERGWGLAGETFMPWRAGRGAYLVDAKTQISGRSAQVAMTK